MPYVWSIERMAREEGIETGRLEGRLEGKLEGRLEGKLEGKLEERLESKVKLRKLVSNILVARFGVAARDFVDTELATADEAQLELVTTKFLQFQSLDELREAINRS